MAGRSLDLMDLRDLVRRLRTTTNDSAIQRDTGLNRRTIRRYRAWAVQQGLLDGPLPPIEELAQLAAQTLQPPAPPQTVSSVEPYRAFVLELHATGVEGAAIYQRLRERGFTGSLSAVYRFLHQLRPSEPEATVRVETVPGQEAQVDFGYAGRMVDPANGQLRKAWAFVMVLAWSRFMYVEFAWDQTVATWLRLHRQAFEFFGGVPRRVVLDNLKAGVTHACFDDPQIQYAYRECAEHYGFLIAPCRPRTPEHKGKVEQGGVHYVKRNFLGGRTPTTLAQANLEVRQWSQTTAGERIHGTTKQPPLTRFTDTERAVLLPLPVTPYDLATWKVAMLQRDCYVVFNNAFYSAPFRLIGQRLHVRGGSQDVQLFTQDWQRVATHPRAKEPGERLTHPDHLPPQKLPGLQLGTERCLERATEIGAATRQVVETLLADPVVDRLRTTGRILALAERVGADRLEAACARALAYDEVSHRAIKAILAQGLEQPAPPTPTSPPARQFVRSATELFGHLFGGGSWT
jgi:transposase